MGYPQDERGATIIATTWENSEGFDPFWTGHLYTATAGATNIFDEVITTEIRLRGGWYELLGSNQAELGDYVEFAVVDKDDVLGLFSTYGLTVGVDVLELKKYVIKDYVNPSSATREVFMSQGAFSVAAGLYLRTIYESIGTTDVDFKTVVLAYD